MVHCSVFILLCLFDGVIFGDDTTAFDTCAQGSESASLNRCLDSDPQELQPGRRPCAQGLIAQWPCQSIIFAARIICVISISALFHVHDVHSFLSLARSLSSPSSSSHSISPRLVIFSLLCVCRKRLSPLCLCKQSSYHILGLEERAVHVIMRC